MRNVEILLANTSKWTILIVRYTNHALYQEEEVNEEARERIIDMSSEEEEGTAQIDASDRVQIHLNNIVPWQYEELDGFQQVKKKT